MSKLAIIGGSGLSEMPGLELLRREVVHTPFGEPSGPLTFGAFGSSEVVFLPRHGPAHTISPHKINYRANIWALHHVGVERIIGVAAVGGIRADMGPQILAVPDQIVDYTYGREHTFFDQDFTRASHIDTSCPYCEAPISRNLFAEFGVTHIDFTHPYCEELRQGLLEAAEDLVGQPVVPEGTYGATQGPRLETAQEIQRLERDGCDLVGMTGMPEASLAREMGLCYACCALVVNWAAGKGEGVISLDEIERNLRVGMGRVRTLLAHYAGGPVAKQGLESDHNLS